MRIGIVYTSISVTKNTAAIAEILKYELQKKHNAIIDIYDVRNFPYQKLDIYDAFIIGTYTWGNGDIPRQMEKLFKFIEVNGTKDLVTAVFGSGDSFYPYFCGAVDKFRDMLYHHTDLAVTLKVELFPQKKDERKCIVFSEKIINRLKNKNRMVMQ